MLNVFLSTCINSEEAKEKWITSRTNNETFNAKLELENLAQNGTIDGGTKQKIDLEYLTPEVKSMLENLELGAIRSQLDQNFCFDENDSLNKIVEKKRNTKGTAKTPNSSTKFKARNVLNNIS